MSPCLATSGVRSCDLHRRGGFALVIALAMMSLILGLILAITAQMNRSQRSSADQASAQLARQNALFGVWRALGDLQASTGPDRRITASASLFDGGNPAAVPNPHWVGVWDAASSTPGPLRWLVSGENPRPDSAVPAATRIVLVGPGSVGSNQAEEVYAERVAIAAQTPGGYAYWIADENAKADASVSEPLAEIGDSIKQAIYNTAKKVSGTADAAAWGQSWIKQSLPARVSFEDILNGFWGTGIDQDSAPTLEQLPRTFSFPELALLDTPANRNGLFHSLTVGANGLLENPIDGGLKYNADEAVERAMAGQPPAGAYLRNGDILRSGNLDDFLALQGSLRFPGNFMASPPANVEVALDGTEENNERLFPILSEAVIYFAVFQRSGQPAMRFYIDAEFYNPYPFPIQLNEVPSSQNIRYPYSGQAFHVVFRNLPEMRLIKQQWNEVLKQWDTLDSTASIPIDDIPISRSSGPRWNASWMEFDTPGGTRNPFLFPGETYRLEDPDPARQPQGLWKDVSSWNGGGRDSIGRVDPSHRIVVQCAMPPNVSGFDVEVYSWDGQNAPTESVLDRVQPVFAVRDIPYERLFSYIFDKAGEGDPAYLQGEGFGGDIDVSDMYIFGFHYRFLPRWDDPKSLELLANLDLRSREFVYGDTVTGTDGRSIPVSDFIGSAAFNPVDVENNLSGVFPGTDLFSDTTVRSSKMVEYRDVRIYDIANRKPLSIADLRHTRVDNRPPLALGSEWGREGFPSSTGDLNASFDRYFLSTVPETNWTKDDGQALPNTRLAVTAKARADAGVDQSDLGAVDAARHFEVHGSFNLNSTSVDAWHAVLKSDLVGGVSDWTYNQRVDSGFRTVYNDRSASLRNVFFKRPFSANFNIDPVADDSFANGSRLTDLSNDTSRTSSMFNQGFRALEGDSAASMEDDQIRHLAWHIVEGIKEFATAEGRPLVSVSELLGAGIIQDAIEAVGESPVTAAMVAQRLGATKPINDFSVPAPPGGSYPKNQHPAALTQADVAATLAPFLSHRSDTFLIRSYGDTVNPQTGEVASRALVEAKVQRVVDSTTPGALPNPIDDASNLELGRQFRIVSFKWLDPGDG